MEDWLVLFNYPVTNYPVTTPETFFLIFQAKDTVKSTVRKSATACEIMTPFSPINWGKINRVGIKNTPCLHMLSMAPSFAFPIARNKVMYTIWNPKKINIEQFAIRA